MQNQLQKPPTGPDGPRQWALAVRPGSPYWEILCTPGPLAGLLHHLAGLSGPIPVERIERRTVAIIPLTPVLDTALVDLSDAIIHLRYESGRVQLELFSLREV